MEFKLWLESLVSPKLQALKDYLTNHGIKNWPTDKVLPYLAKWPGTIEIYEDNIDDDIHDISEPISKFPLVIQQNRWEKNYVPLEQNKENLERIWELVKRDKTYLHDFMQYFLEFHTSAYDEPTYTQYYFDVVKELPPNTWIIHQTDADKATQIKISGFQIGMKDLRKLGTTVYIPSNDPLKSEGGYNFGYLSSSYHIKNTKYGDTLLMFMKEGLLVYHAQDQDEQVIFDGKSVNPQKIVVIKKENNEYVVKSQIPNQPDPFKNKDILQTIKWIRQNFTKFRNIIT